MDHIPLSENFCLFSGRASLGLAEEVAELLGHKLRNVQFQTYNEGEVHVQIDDSDLLLFYHVNQN